MPVWCPKCNAMLNEGLEKCPICGSRLPAAGKAPASQAASDRPIDAADGVQITLFLLGFLLIPVIILIALGLICAVVSNLGG